MRRIPLGAALTLASAMVAPPSQTASAQDGATQAVPQAKVTTIATFAGVSAREVAALAKGNLLYLSTDSNVVLVYDRARKKTSVALKGDFYGIHAASTGHHLGLLRLSEDRKSYEMWTVAVDPVSGLATGAPRRVGMTPASWMRTSPNGKEIAFVSNGDFPSKILVVPFNGGRERLIAEGFYSGPIRWPPDGKWIYFSKWEANGSNARVVKAPAAGGAPVEVTPSVRNPIPGVTPDGRYVMAVTDGQGLDVTFTTFDVNVAPVGKVELKFPVDGIRLDYAWSHDGYHIVYAMKTITVVTHAADYTGVRSRVIPGLNTAGAALSPDNTLIISSEFDSNNRAQTVLRNADGSNPKVLASMGLGRASVVNYPPLVNPWSPDGRLVAYPSDTMRTLMVYDTKTGKSFAVARAGLGIGQWHFRSDGKAVLYVAFDGEYPKVTVTAREVTLDGKSRVLRDVSVEAPGGGAFLGDSVLWSAKLTKLLPFGGTPRPMFDVVPDGTPVPAGSNPFSPALSPDAKWLARTAVNRKGIDLAAVDGSTTRTLPVSFTFDPGNAVKFHPNGREIIAPAAPAGNTPGGLMAVPLDGSAARRVVTFGKGEKLASYSISSDGKTIVYAVSGTPATVLLDIDLSPGIPGRH